MAEEGIDIISLSDSSYWVDDHAGTWQQYVVVHVSDLYPVRPEIPNEDASQFFINPVTGEEP